MKTEIPAIISFLILLMLLLVPSSFADSNYGEGGYGGGVYGGVAEAAAEAAEAAEAEEMPAITGWIPPEIEVEPTEINVRLVVNTDKEYIIKVTNPSNSKKTVQVSHKNLDNMVILGEDSLELEPGETGDLRVIFVALNETGIFIGKIIIGNKEVLVSLNVKTKLLLFDSNIVVLNKDYIVEQGDKLRTQVSLIPRGDKERLDVTLNYVIKDYGDRVYLTKSETLLVEEEFDFERNFNIGLLPVGKYIIGLELVYPGGVAPSSAHFKVIEREPLFALPEEIPLQVWIIIGAISLFVILAAIAYLVKRGRTKQRKKKLRIIRLFVRISTIIAHLVGRWRKKAVKKQKEKAVKKQKEKEEIISKKS